MTKRCTRAAALGLALLAACNRERAHAPPPAAAGSPAEQATWVARPSELTADQVRAVQSALAARGFPIEATGHLDGRTHTAIGDFQRSRGLPSTGNLNAETADALGLDPVAMMPAREPGDLPADVPAPAGVEDPATRPSRDVAGGGEPPTRSSRDVSDR